MASTIHASRAGLTRTISTGLGAGAKLSGFAAGLIGVGEFMPANHPEYQQYRRLMHDVLCEALIDSGHYSNHEITLSKLGISTNNSKLNRQKPDLYTAAGGMVSICEVTMTYAAEKDRLRKAEKYLDFLQTLRDNEFDVVYNVLVVDLTDAEWEDKIPKVSELYLAILRDFVDNLRYIHSNATFNFLRKEETGLYQTDRFAFVLDDDALMDNVEKATGVKMNADQIKARLALGSREGYTDTEYISRIAQGLLDSKWHERPKPHPASLDPVGLIKDWESFKSVPSNCAKLPRILQLGSPSLLIEESEEFVYEQFVNTVKGLKNFGGYLDLIKSALQGDEPNEDHIIKLGLSSSQVEQEQMQGPGRKSILKRLGIKSERKAPRHIGIDTEHEVYLTKLTENIEDLSRDCKLLEYDLPSLRDTGLPAGSLISKIMSMVDECPMSSILKFYQRISNEIIINSMKRRKNREYVLCRSGFKEVFFIIAPGPQLRTESNTEFIKIISMVPPLHNVLSAPYDQVGDHWESEWLSVDTNRLKHWQRAYDRVVLSFVGTCERLVLPDCSMMEAVKLEIKMTNYHLLALSYLEDKQLTSVTNQTIRYLWMKSIGDKQFSDIMSKFPSRVGSIIQSVMMQRSMTSCIRLCKTNLSDLVKLGSASRDSETGNYDETTTGVVGKLPRLVTLGGLVPISYNLNEIYYCMAYNKDRQNMTQDALSILKKVLKEEDKYNMEIASRESPNDKVSYFLGNTTVLQDLSHIRSTKPESHYFSYRAVLTGMRLQDKHVENMGDNGSWKVPEKIEAILGKNLSQFATFKASVKSIATQINVSDMREINKIGRRTKAIELVAELVDNEQLMTVSDVAMSYSGDASKAFEVLIQIFKKGQIGGVREIIILFIKARVLFNILEEIARLMAKSDKREILTKGRDKRLMMRGDYEEVMSSFSKGTPVKVVKDSYDMTTWAQKFIPTIFLPIYETHFADFPGLLDFSRMVFLAHSNKKIEYPSRLVEQWMLHPDVKHPESGIQKAKEAFLSTGVPYFVNHSNMCQGIPHYNSTILALSCMSLRDALFHKCLEILKQEKKIRWKSRLGSDDKGNIIGIDMSSDLGYKQYLLFGQCEHAAERLHSMELSVKSASGHLMYELNSAFMANLETLSPTVKFTMAATDVIGTTSCSSFVNESYGRIRQLRENGGSSILCGIAHTLNKRHFENIFAVSFGNVNDPRKIFNLQKEQIPYDFGIYPFYDIDLQDIVGPEYHNYRIMKNGPNENIAAQLLFTELSKEEETELFPKEDSPLLKKDHFGIHQGIIKQLSGMRRRVGADPKVVEEFFVNNPFLIIRGPENLQETKMAIHAKLFTKGASEALRRTSPAMYIGRLSAFRSAKAWTATRLTDQKLLDLETGEETYISAECKMTYKDFLQSSIKRIQGKSKSQDISSILHLLYPQWQSYNVIEQFIGSFGPLRTSTKSFSQAVRNWASNTFNYEYSSSLKTILETGFGLSQLAAKEDVDEFRKLLGMKLESLDSFILDCKVKNIRPLDMFFYMTRLHKLSQSTKIQTFAFGPSTSSLHMTALSIKRYNHAPGATMMLDEGVEASLLEDETTMSGKLDLIKLYVNLKLMEKNDSLQGTQGSLNGFFFKGLDIDECVKTTLRSIKGVTGFDYTTQKILKFACSQLFKEDEFKSKLLSWKSMNYSYIKRQMKKYTASGSVQWVGELELLVNSGNDCFTLHEKNGKRYIKARRILDLETLLRSIKEVCKMLDFDHRTLFRSKISKIGDIYLSQGSKSLHVSESTGMKLSVLNISIIEDFKYKRLQDFDNFNIVTTHNSKSGCTEVFLKDGLQRSVTICHFTGVYYPVLIPQSLEVSDFVSYLGIKAHTLFKNRDWFYNGKLPTFGDSESVRFLKQDVDMSVVLSLRDNDLSRIKDYIETKDESYEEMFSLNLLGEPAGYVDQGITDEIIGSAENMMSLFRETFDKLEEEEIFGDKLEALPSITNWAEEMDEESERENAKGMLTGLEDEIDGINYVRSFGYKKPAAKKNMAAISSLQQGSHIRGRILNQFFNGGSIFSEGLKTLPHKYLWINKIKDASNFRLLDAMQQIILERLSVAIGSSPRDIRHKLDTKNTNLSQSIPRLQAYLSGEELDNLDIFDELVEEVFDRADRYETSDSE
jgi:AraC-like DNA-binding protein